MPGSAFPSPDSLAAPVLAAGDVARGIGRLFARNDIWCLPEMPLRSGRRADLMGIDAKGLVVIVEIKVSRADLLGDLKKPAKRAAYLGMASACWYVLGHDAKGRPIAQPEEVPPECGVMYARDGELSIAREAPRRAIERLPFHVWMTLAQTEPAVRLEESGQARF